MKLAKFARLPVMVLSLATDCSGGGTVTEPDIASSGPAVTAPRFSHVEPVVASGKPSCTQLGYQAGLKVEPVVDGTYSDGTLTVTIDVREGAYLDWIANIGVDIAIVKAGGLGAPPTRARNANVYIYDPEATSDTDLQPPINPKNDQPYGLGHVEFCYDL